jgi:putative aldouronate transport system permease protein
MKYTKGENIFNIFNLLILSIVGLVMLYPLLYIFIVSISTLAGAGAIELIPKEITFSAYKVVLGSKELLTALGVSLLRTVVGTFVTVIVTAMCAYALSIKKLPHRNTIMFLIVFTMLFSGGIVPTYMVVKGLGLIDSFFVYIFPMLLDVFCILILKNYFEQIPESIIDSGHLDGAGDFNILFRLYIPLSKPVVATVALITALGHWNSWFDSMIYINNPDLKVLQLLLREMIVESNFFYHYSSAIMVNSDNISSQTIKAAIVVITILPIFIAYPFVQKYFVKGIMLGSTKE